MGLFCFPELVLCEELVFRALSTLAQVTSATAFDSPPLFSNQKRVSVWVSLKVRPEIGSISLYTGWTGTVYNLTGSRSSFPSSIDSATRVCICVWVMCGCTPMFCALCVTFCYIAVLVKHYSPKCHFLWNRLARSDGNIYSLCMTSFTLQTY